MNYPRGSEWRKWDLHLHSPATLLNNQFEGASVEEKWDNYVAKLESISDVRVLGVTDYCSIDGYRKLKLFKDAGRLPKIDMVLPNVELRMLPVTDQTRPINIHFLFNPSIADRLDTLFFQNLEFAYNEATYKCTFGDLVRFGRTFKNDSSLPENTAYEEAVNQCKITPDQIRRILQKNRDLKENCLIAVSNSSNDGNSGIQHSSLVSTREEIYRLAHIIFSGNPNDAIYFLGKGADDVDEVKRRCGSLKPCVMGSDAHKLSDVCAPTRNRFTWIKADPTFAGLKQIVYEPEARVRIQETNPSDEFTKPFFSNLRIGSEAPVFKPDPSYESPRFAAVAEFPINKDLVCIIGGRGTGKSCLIEYLANAFGSSKRAEEFVLSPSFTLTLNKDVSEAITHHASEGVQLPFVFISQSEVKTKVETAAVGAEIKQMLGIQEAGFSLETQTQISKLLGDVTTIESWFQQKNDKGELVNDQAQVHAQLTNTKSLLSSITTEQNKEKLERFTKNVKEHHQIKEKGRLLGAILEQLTSFSTRINQQINDGGGEIPKVDFSAQTQAITELQQKLVDRLQQLDRENEEIRTEFTRVYSGDLSALLGNAESYRLLIEKLETRQNQIARKTQELSDAKEQRKQIAQLILDELQRQKDEIDQRWTAVKNGRAEWGQAQRNLMTKILTDRSITLTGRIVFREDLFRAKILQAVDGRTFRPSGNQTTEQKVKAIFPISDEQTFADFVKRKLHTVIADLGAGHQLADVFYDVEQRSTYLFVEPYLTYSGRPLDKLSVGQKGTVYLCLKLATQAFSQPLIFDQPEDDLDNEFIIKELVEIFRGIKRFRQIILVTHNANLVVNADAEQVIVAENDNGVLRYFTGSLEDAGTNRSIRRILEGGDEAFKRREQRYNLA